MTDGLGKIETKAALVVIPLILASTDRLNRKHVYLIVMAFIVSCTALALYAFFIIFKEYGALDNAAGLTEFIDIAIGLHHAYSGMYLVFAVAAALYLALSGNYRFYSRIVLVLVAVVLYSFLVLLAARTAVFTSFFLFFLFVVYSLVVSKKKQNYLVAGLACVAVLLIVLSLPNTKHKVEEFNKLKGVHNPMTPRLIKWKCCFTILKEQNAWGIGVGTGDVQDHLQQCYADEKFWGDRYLLNAHNEFLEEMVRHGFPGALLLLVSLLYPLWLSIKLNKKLYTVFLVVFIMSSLTESTLSRQKGVVFYALFNSVFAFSCLRSKTVDMLLEKPGQVVV
jgi:O-antigen ligase